MKTIMSAFLSLCLLSFFVIACKKDSSSSGKSSLTLSKASVKMGEPLVVATNATSSNVFTKWSVNPSANTWISSANNKSVILFSSPGSYVVTASYFSDSTSPVPYDSSSSTVTVTDSVYIDSTASCNVIQQVPVNVGDQITLTPISYSDTGLVLLAHTQGTYGNYYPALGNIQFSDSTNNGYAFAFGTITEYPCSISSNGPTPATGSLSFSGLTNGTHNVTIVLNDVSYKGSLVVTDTDCTFTWNYSSGVIIYPLHIQKQ